MSHLHPSVRVFIDDEAGVDTNEEDNEDDMQDVEDINFIDDRINTRNRYIFPPDNLTSHLLNDEDLFNDDDENETVTQFYDDLLARASKNANTTSYRLQAKESLLDDVLLRQTRIDDHPIWKIECRIGLEEIAICSLLRTTETIHQLRSAFTRGSIRGHIYLECQMNNYLRDLLAKTPGIIHSAHGIRSKIIDPMEYQDLLCMKSTKIDITIGKWVRVKRGIYKGDVGRVKTTHAWGVDLYLVPRIPTENSGNTLKRKASTVVPEADLFYPQDSTLDVVYHPDGSYGTGRLIFEHGLVIKSFDYHSIGPQVCEIPWKLYTMFSLSAHPDISLSSLPRPQEWKFATGDNIIIHPSNNQGRISSIDTDFAEVEISEQGLHRVPWQNIRKSFKIGDFVCISGGPNHNMNGFVIEINEDIATIANKTMEGEIIKNFDDAINTVNVHLNYIVAASIPFQHATKTQPTSPSFQLEKQHKHPWCGTNVIISKQGHPRKGETGEVTHVLFSQSTATGLRLTIRLTQYGPSTPFQSISVDYDDVHEITSHLKLNKYFNCEDRRPIKPPPQAAHITVNDSGGSTPMPTETSSTSPAWDPSSRSPLNIPIYSPPATNMSQPDSEPQQVNSSIANPPQPQNQHVLLNPLLANKKLNAIVNGGEYQKKSLEVTISMARGQVHLGFIKHDTCYPLKPEWVTPKHPNPPHDNGLLIIIKGDHCSKYARRVHHRHSDAGSTIILAITEKVEGSTDILTDERLELAPEYLCTVSESKREKDLNRDLMKSVRTAYRKK